MLEFLKMPEVWFGAAGVVCACMAGYIAYEIAVHEFHWRGFVEPEPEIDLDMLEAELQMLAAVIEYSFANERRREMVARAV